MANFQLFTLLLTLFLLTPGDVLIVLADQRNESNVYNIDESKDNDNDNNVDKVIYKAEEEMRCLYDVFEDMDKDLRLQIFEGLAPAVSLILESKNSSHGLYKSKEADIVMHNNGHNDNIEGVDHDAVDERSSNVIESLVFFVAFCILFGVFVTGIVFGFI